MFFFDFACLKINSRLISTQNENHDNIDDFKSDQKSLKMISNWDFK